jgi:hypothetical protein
MKQHGLYREQELAFRTQYAELKERVSANLPILPGTPGTLTIRAGSGNPYWYRVFNSVPGKQSEELVCKPEEAEKLQAMRERIAFAEWVAQQVPSLRKLGFQVADKNAARVLVELHNKGAFEAGLVLVGSLGFMAWLNELGAIAVSAHTEDLDLGRRHQLKLATPLAFLSTLQATGMPFNAVPGMPASEPATAVKLRGAQGLRVDILAPGPVLGAIIKVPELDWAAQAIPYYDYLLEAPEPAALLAGWQCIPVRLPQAGRFVWHKLYSSLHRRGFPEKAEKDRQQAFVLAAVLTDTEPVALSRAFEAVPRAMADELSKNSKSFLAHAAGHQEMSDALTRCLAR